MMLSPKGAPFCDVAIDALFSAITSRYGITRGELEAMARFNWREWEFLKHVANIIRRLE